MRKSAITLLLGSLCVGTIGHAETFNAIEFGEPLYFGGGCNNAQVYSIPEAFTFLMPELSAVATQEGENITTECNIYLPINLTNTFLGVLDIDIRGLAAVKPIATGDINITLAVPGSEEITIKKNSFTSTLDEWLVSQTIPISTLCSDETLYVRIKSVLNSKIPNPAFGDEFAQLIVDSIDVRVSSLTSCPN